MASMLDDADGGAWAFERERKDTPPTPTLPTRGRGFRHCTSLTQCVSDTEDDEHRHCRIQAAVPWLAALQGVEFAFRWPSPQRPLPLVGRDRVGGRSPYALLSW